MFCDGKCKKKNKKCGLFREVYKDINGKIEPFEECIFLHMLESQLRVEQGNIRLQSAVESGRNEKANSDHMIANTIATGFVGIMHTINEDENAIPKMKYLGKVIKKTDNEIEIYKEEQAKLLPEGDV